ncbi:hypothetical protein DM860_000094 [Cuscuta australis]|uniref:Uncharacterized protein n=1 Tax=Cuscuta australis TaxID=267555 RepID=A0A328CXK7_9ASTE|nr:hypothetical protein DM860_000094 [Cuscuta australis]
MDVKRRLPQWMHCMPAADHEKKKSRTRDSSNGEEEDEAEVKKNFKPEDGNDGRVKKKPRIKDSINGGENAEGLKKKTKTRYAKYGENIDRKAVKKGIESEDVKTEKLEKDKFRTQKSRDDEKDLKQEVDEGTQKSWRKTSLEDYDAYLETKKHFGASKNIDESEPPPVRIHGTKAKHSVIEITDKNKRLPQTQDDEVILLVFFYSNSFLVGEVKNTIFFTPYILELGML